MTNADIALQLTKKHPLPDGLHWAVLDLGWVKILSKAAPNHFENAVCGAITRGPDVVVDTAWCFSHVNINDDVNTDALRCADIHEAAEKLYSIFLKETFG